MSSLPSLGRSAESWTVGGVVSNAIIVVAVGPQLPAPSRTRACTVFMPSPNERFQTVVPAYGIGVTPV